MPGRFDDIVGPSYKPEIAIFILSGQVASDIPVFYEAVAVFFLIVQISPKHGGPALFNRQVTGLIRGKKGNMTFLSIRHHRRFNAWHRPSHRPGFDVHCSIVGYHDAPCLSLPPVIINGHSQCLPGPANRFRVERFSYTQNKPEMCQTLFGPAF